MVTQSYYFSLGMWYQAVAVVVVVDFVCVDGVTVAVVAYKCGYTKLILSLVCAI